MKLRTFTGEIQINGLPVLVSFDQNKLVFDLAGLAQVVLEKDLPDIVTTMVVRVEGIVQATPEASVSPQPYPLVPTRICTPVVQAPVVRLKSEPLETKGCISEAPAATPACGDFPLEVESTTAPVASPVPREPSAPPKLSSSGRMPRLSAKPPGPELVRRSAPDFKFYSPPTGSLSSPVDVTAQPQQRGNSVDDEPGLDYDDTATDTSGEAPDQETDEEDATAPVEVPQESRDEDIPESVRSALRVREVLAYLRDQRGFKTKASIVKECMRLKDSITVLGRMGTDLEARMDRAAAALGIE